MKWDGYAGTIREVEFPYVAEAVASSLNGMIVLGKPRRRYAEVLDVEVAGRMAAWVGADRGNGTVYFEGKGETSPDLVRAIRVHFPGHTVSRADVAEDYEGEGVFERLVDLVRARKGDRTYGGFVKLPDNPDDGRTWEAGRRGQQGSGAYMRVYEAGKMRDRSHLARPQWVRAELEVHPRYARDKAAAATMEPLAMWGMAAWTHRVGQALAAIEIPKYEGQERHYSHDKTTAYLARTFRRHWGEMLATFGDWECVGRELQSVWQIDDEAAEALRRAGLQ